jgi:EPS-associated MarR family transcriptional regulator
MSEQKNIIPLSDNEDVYSLLTALDSEASPTQRELASRMDVSLGKVNYLIKELIVRGLVSVRNFSLGDQKVKKVRYILTQKGFNARVELVQYFIKKKEAEFNTLKAELAKMKSGEVG